MRKLVFLHGYGGDKEAYQACMKSISDVWGADYIGLNAPFKHPEKPGYKWFGKVEKNGRRDAIIEEYEYALAFIKKQLSDLGKTEDIILIGHSQGGGMAVHVGLEMALAGVVSINGDIPYNISYQKRTKTPIYWIESKRDTYINESRKESYRLIKENNNFHLLTLENSTHNDFQEDLLEAVRNKIIRF